MTITTNAATKVAAVATGLTMAFSMLAAAPVAHAAALSSAQVSAIISLLQSFGADATTIANVQASLTGSAPSTGGGSTGGTSAACTFTRDLTTGASGADVTCLQQALIAAGYSIPAGATGYFGSQTVAAVSAWQKAAGVSPTAGYFGAKSRAAFNLGGGTTGGTTGPITGNGLKVMLATDSPNGTALVQGQAVAVLGKFTFANPTGSPVMVTNVAFKRIGVSNDSTMTNVYLYNGAVRVTDAAGVSNSAFNFNNPTGLFTVPAGGSITMSVSSDIAGSTAGQQIGVQLTSVAASGALDTSVALPITGGLQAVSAATLANADFAITTLPSASTVDPQADYTVWQNTITVGTRAVLLKSFALRQIGSAQVGDVVNYRLYVDGTKVGNAVAAKDANDMITFDLSASPVRLETGGRVVKVVADVVSGASRTFQLSVRYAGDAVFVDTDLNQPVLPRGDGSSITATFAAHSATSATINSVSTAAPSISRAADSPTSNVSVGASNVKWATFKIIANAEAVKVDNLNVTADTSSSGSGLDNGKVFLNGVQVGSTKDIAEFGGTTTNFTFGSSFIVPIGQTAVIDIYGDAKTTAAANLTSGETVRIYLGVGSSNANGQTSLTSINVPASELTGNSITVTSAGLTAGKASYYGNQTVIAGATGVKIGAFTLSAGSTEGINVNTIDIGFANAVSSTITNLTVKDKDTGAMFGSAKSTVSTTNSFAGSVNIPASGSKTYDIFADIKSTAENGVIGAGAPATADQSYVTTSTTGTGLVTGTTASVASNVTLQDITVGSATLTAGVSANNPVNDNALMGAGEVKVGSFTFSAANSNFTVSELMVKIPSDAASSVTDVTVKYKDAAGVTQSSTQPLITAAIGPHATSTFTGLTFHVPAGNSAEVDVYVGITSSENANTGAAISALIDWNSGFKATNSAGSVSTSVGSADLNSAASTGYGTKYAKKTIPTLARLSTGYTTNTVASGVGLYRFSVTADAAGAVEWRKIAFDVTSSGVVAFTYDLYDVTSGTGVVVNDAAQAISSNKVTIYKSNINSNNVEQIGAGQTKIYELRPVTVTGWGDSGDSITVDFAEDTSAVVSASSASLSDNFIWSDRDASSHTTITSDWTNGYLVKNTTDDVRTCQYGTATTCTP